MTRTRKQLTRCVLSCAVSGMLVAAMASVGGVAAQTAGGSPAMPVRTVSGGTVVLSHDANAFDRAPQLTIDAAPTAVLGGSGGDPEYDLTMARVAVLLPDGRVAALARVGNRLLIFAADGRGERSLGRTGQGPGELMRPGGLLLMGGDTLLVPDGGNRRLNLVLPQRGIVASEPLQDAAIVRMVDRAAGVLRDGTIVLHAAGMMQQGVADSVVRPPVRVFVFDRATGAAREVATIPDIETAMIQTRYRGRPGLEARPLRFTRRAHIAVWDTLIVTGSGNGFEIDLRTKGGTVVSRLRVAAKRRPVTPAMRSAQVARELEQFEGPGSERMVDAAESRRIAREAPFADSLPPYGQIFVTREGILWVVDAIAPSDTAWTATAFRRDGAITGRLRVSDRSVPLDFAGDRVVLRTEDEDGVVALRVHRLIAAGATGRRSGG